MREKKCASEMWEGVSVMAKGIWMLVLCSTLATAIPTITFPLNSQVPPVARVSRPFSFTFSASTFASDGTLTYTLSNAPSWLSLNGATRTLSGTPPEEDADTAPVIGIIAADSTGSVTMSATLVISSDPAPEVAIPLNRQLEKFGEYSAPNSLLYYPSTPFSFSFDAGTFTYKGSSANLNKYAVTLDNTPLPSWVKFDGSTMTFSGETPDSGSLIQPPELFGIQLIASEVLGFSGIAIPFHIVVENHKLVWHDSFLELNASIGVPVNFESLSGSLELDHATVSSSDLVSVDTDAPTWLKFDNTTFTLSGTPPEDASSFNVTVVARDKHDDIATAIIHITIPSSIFLPTEIPPVNATIGEAFSYNVSLAFINPSVVDVSVSISPQTPWLAFDSKTLMLSGEVPESAVASSISITLTATSKSVLSKRATDTKTFTINVVSASSSSTSTVSTPTSTSKSSKTAAAAAIAVPVKSGLSPGEIAAAVIVPIIVVLLIALLLFCCWRRRKHRQYLLRAITPMKSDISKPVLQEPHPILSRHGSPTSMHPSLRPHLTNISEDIYGSEDSFSTRPYEMRRSVTLSKVSTCVSSRPQTGYHHMQRSFSENYISERSWPSTTRGGTESGAATSRNAFTQNFSLKTGATQVTHETEGGVSRVLTQDSAWGVYPFRTGSQRTQGSIQGTPEVSYSAATAKYRVHKRQAPNYLGSISAISTRRYTGVGHGRSGSALSERSVNSQGRWGSFGRGGYGYSMDMGGVGMASENSWLTIPSSPKKDRVNGMGMRPYSTMSAVTESTDVLYADYTELPPPIATAAANTTNSTARSTIRLVPPSSSPPVPDLLTNPASSSTSSVARPVSRRGAGSSPFFSGSTRTNSRAASRRSARLLEAYIFADGDATPVPGAEETNAALERSILRELRRGSGEAGRDVLGIRYGNGNGDARRSRGSQVYAQGRKGAEESTRQLRSFVSSISKRGSWQASVGRRGSGVSVVSDASSRFRGAEESPNLYARGASRDQENTVDEYASNYGDDDGGSELRRHKTGMSAPSSRSPRTFRDSMGNSIRYGEDESPELAAASYVERLSGASPYQGLFVEGGRGLGVGSGGRATLMSPRFLEIGAGERVVRGPERVGVVTPGTGEGSWSAERWGMGMGVGVGSRGEEGWVEERRRMEREETPGGAFL